MLVMSSDGVLWDIVLSDDDRFMNQIIHLIDQAKEIVLCSED